MVGALPDLTTFSHPTPLTDLNDYPKITLNSKASHHIPYVQRQTFLLIIYLDRRYTILIKGL